jgi:hypothetical protein
MDQEREDYADHDVPVGAIESPADLLWAFARTIGVLALSFAAVLGLVLLWRAAARRLIA